MNGQFKQAVWHGTVHVQGLKDAQGLMSSYVLRYLISSCHRFMVSGLGFPRIRFVLRRLRANRLSDSALQSRCVGLKTEVCGRGGGGGWEARG